MNDTAIRAVFSSLLDIRGDQDIFNLAHFPCRLGGVGLRNAARGAQAAFWSTGHESCGRFHRSVVREKGGPHVEAAARCRKGLLGVIRRSRVGRFRSRSPTRL